MLPCNNVTCFQYNVSVLWVKLASYDRRDMLAANFVNVAFHGYYSPDFRLTNCQVTD